jgi:translation initiation factor 2B subunit (eIF-2B alpha/beta/delta family)
MSQRGSYVVAETTLSTIKTLIGQSEWNSAKELMALLRREGKNMVEFLNRLSTTIG